MASKTSFTSTAALARRYFKPPEVWAPEAGNDDDGKHAWRGRVWAECILQAKRRKVDLTSADSEILFVVLLKRLGYDQLGVGAMTVSTIEQAIDPPRSARFIQKSLRRLQAARILTYELGRRGRFENIRIAEARTRRFDDPAKFWVKRPKASRAASKSVDNSAPICSTANGRSRSRGVLPSSAPSPCTPIPFALSSPRQRLFIPREAVDKRQIGGPPGGPALRAVPPAGRPIELETRLTPTGRVATATEHQRALIGRPPAGGRALERGLSRADQYLAQLPDRPLGLRELDIVERLMLEDGELPARAPP